ncbi:hypothetical protein FB451DRAFT_1187657 [Mycena latifolia]|nr:hypothetical protein FB451DRAFT_1187657 [Mycena latifolia]
MAAGGSGGRPWWWCESENVGADERDGRGIVENARGGKRGKRPEECGVERAGGWRQTLWGRIHRKWPEMWAERTALSEVCGVDRVWEVWFKRSGSGMDRMHLGHAAVFEKLDPFLALWGFFSYRIELLGYQAWQSGMKSEVYCMRGASPSHGTLRWQAPELMLGSSELAPEMSVYSPLSTDEAVRKLMLIHPPFSKIVKEAKQLRKAAELPFQGFDVPPSPPEYGLLSLALENRHLVSTASPEFATKAVWMDQLEADLEAKLATARLGSDKKAAGLSRFQKHEVINHGLRATIASHGRRVEIANGPLPVVKKLESWQEIPFTWSLSASVAWTNRY